MSRAPSDLQGRLRRALEPHYAVERELGRGAMGVVFLADDRRHDRAVAIKLLLPELATALGAERFLREIRTTARLQHPNILPLYDSGEADGLLYYIMPYVPGESLGSRLERDGALPPAEALRVAHQVAGALAAAHEAGVLHRDVKPENVLLAPGGHAWVADFGVARALSGVGGQRLTSTGLIVGSPAYLSPEQIASEEEVDGRSDVYSLGCVLYEMLAGRPPYWAGSAQGILTRHLTEPVPDVSAVRPEVPAAAGEVVRRALAKDPAERPTAAELLDLLAGAAAGTLTRSALPSSAPSRPGLVRVDRRRAVLAAGIVALLGGGAVLVERGVVPVSLAALREDEPVNSMRPAEQTIAVLPFENLSGDPKNRYFIDGVTEDIQTSLSGLESLKVISGGSSAHFQGPDVDLRALEKELGVEKVVMGSVRMDRDQVRIVARLVDTRTGEQIWAERYDRKLQDIFTIQTAIANQVLASLRTEMTLAQKERLADAPTGSLTAYDFYLKGRDRLRQYRETSNAQVALGNFGQALELDPNYAQAAAGMALSYQFLYEARGGTDVDSAMSYARRAIRADPALADGYSVLGRALLSVGRVSAAREQLSLALERNPNDLIGITEMGRAHLVIGRYDEAVVWLKRAAALQPTEGIRYARVGEAYHKLGDLALAEQWLQRALQLEPDLPWANVLMMYVRMARSDERGAERFAEAVVTASPLSHWSHEHAGTFELMRGDLRAALRHFERADSLRPADDMALLELAYIHARNGADRLAEPILRWHERDAADRIRRGMETPDAQVSLARIHAVRGERDAAIRALRRAHALGERNYDFYRGDPLLNPLRGEPEFQALLASVRDEGARMRENVRARGW